jgi:hypothetical protein
MIRTVWQYIRANPKRIAFFLIICLAFFNMGLLASTFQKKKLTRQVTAQLEPIELDLAELRQAEQEGFKKLQADVDRAEAHLMSLERSFPDLGASFEIFRRGFELAEESGIEVASVYRGSTVVRETVLGHLFTTTFSIKSNGDMQSCLGFLSRLEKEGLQTLALDRIDLNPDQQACNFDVIIASGTLLDNPEE